jgi:hypothetical protein
MHPTSCISGLGPHVDDPVCAQQRIRVVLDRQHRMAGSNQLIEDVEQACDVVDVQAGGGFIEYE